jgi:hypothetical protein
MEKPSQPENLGNLSPLSSCLSEFLAGFGYSDSRVRNTSQEPPNRTVNSKNKFALKPCPKDKNPLIFL